MNLLIATLFIVIAYCILASPLDEEHFSVASQEAKIEMCQRFGGCASCGGGDNNTQVCVMPPTVQNEQILNWQMAGRVCDLDYLYETQGCRTPGTMDVGENPQNKNANRGNFHYNA